MLAKTQLKFSGTIGSNSPHITKEILAGILANIEMEYNTRGMTGSFRIHIDEDNEDSIAEEENA